MRRDNAPGLKLEVRKTFIDVPEASAGSRARTLRGHTSYPDAMDTGARSINAPGSLGVDSASFPAPGPVPDAQDLVDSLGAPDSQESAFSFRGVKGPPEVSHPLDTERAAPSASGAEERPVHLRRVNRDGDAVPGSQDSAHSSQETLVNGMQNLCMSNAYANDASTPTPDNERRQNAFMPLGEC